MSKNTGGYQPHYAIIAARTDILFATCGTSPFEKKRADAYRKAHAIRDKGRVATRVSGIALLGAFCICHVAHCIAHGEHARVSNGEIDSARRTVISLLDLMDKMQLVALARGPVAEYTVTVPWLAVLANLRSWLASAENDDDISAFVSGTSDRMRNEEFFRVCQSIDFARGWLASQDKPLTSGVEDA